MVQNFMKYIPTALSDLMVKSVSLKFGLSLFEDP